MPTRFLNMRTTWNNSTFESAAAPEEDTVPFGRQNGHVFL